MQVIIGSKSGQLANRLFAFSHFIGYAVEHRCELSNPSFDEYCHYFDATARNEFSGYRISVARPGRGTLYCFLLAILRRLIPKSPWHICHVLPDGVEMNLDDVEFASIANDHSRILVFGWAYRDYRNLRKHAPLVRKFFRPAGQNGERVERYFTEVVRRGRDGVVVGVHIRRGDYRQWRGGAYFFDDGVYADKMAQIERQFHEAGTKVRFLLCSNEEIDAAGSFRYFDCVPGAGSELEDLYLLARCDLIIGPPSTYSMWASFYGEVPLFCLNQPDEMVDLAKFEVFLSSS